MPTSKGQDTVESSESPESQAFQQGVTLYSHSRQSAGRANKVNFTPTTPHQSQISLAMLPPRSQGGTSSVPNTQITREDRTVSFISPHCLWEAYWIGSSPAVVPPIKAWITHKCLLQTMEMTPWNLKGMMQGRSLIMQVFCSWVLTLLTVRTAILKVHSRMA